jgi:hypothetical protein
MPVFLLFLRTQSVIQNHQSITIHNHRAHGSHQIHYANPLQICRTPQNRSLISSAMPSQNPYKHRASLAHNHQFHRDLQSSKTQFIQEPTPANQSTSTVNLRRHPSINHHLQRPPLQSLPLLLQSTLPS